MAVTSGSPSILRASPGCLRSAFSAIPAPACAAFDVRMLVTFLLFFAFGYFCANLLGHFTPRQLGTFWPIYFMLFYTIAGLWFGYAFVAIGLGIIALTLIGYFFIGDAFLLWMAVRQRRRAHSGRPLDAPELERWPNSTTSSTSRCGLRIMAALNALPAARGARILPAEKADRRHRRQSRRPYRDAGEGRLCRGRQGLCRQEAADHGDRHRGRARRLRPPCRDLAGNHRGLGAAAYFVIPGASKREPGSRRSLGAPDRRAARRPE